MTFQIDKESPLPMHIQLLNELRRLVLSGEIKPHSRVISEPQLVETLNISRTTIRQAWQAAELEGLLYRVPGKGTYVAEMDDANQHTATIIGFLIPDFRSTFDSQLLSGAEVYLRSRGYRVMFAHSDRDVVEENRLMREMRRDGVRGFLLWPTLADDQPRFLQGNTLPAVLMDRHIPGLSYPCVSADHYQGAVQAIQHLIALGHTNIAFVARPHLQLTSIADRLRGYEDMMRKAGLKPLPPVIVGVERELSTPRAQSAHEQDREDEIKQLQAVLKQKDRPTALFAMNDLMALLILRAAEAAGVKIPDEVSLVGFDDLDLVSQVRPPLTTVRQDPWEIGQVSARILLDLIGGTPPTAQTILLPTHLIVRSSTISR